VRWRTVPVFSESLDRTLFDLKSVTPSSDQCSFDLTYAAYMFQRRFGDLQMPERKSSSTDTIKRKRKTVMDWLDDNMGLASLVLILVLAILSYVISRM
jgi:hypothetical protein